MKNYLKNLIAEKSGMDMTTSIEVEGPSGLNIMTLSTVVEAINATSAAEKKAIRKMLVLIDFRNGDVLDYFKHLAKAIAL